LVLRAVRELAEDGVYAVRVGCVAPLVGTEIELQQEHKFTREDRERRIEDAAFSTGAAGGSGTLPLLPVGED
jgi:hypothetical protein